MNKKLRLGFIGLIGLLLLSVFPSQTLKATEVENSSLNTVNDLYFSAFPEQELPQETVVGEKISVNLMIENEGYNDIKIPLPDTLSFDLNETINNSGEYFDDVSDIHKVITQKENELLISVREYRKKVIPLTFIAAKPSQNTELKALSSIEGYEVESSALSFSINDVDQKQESLLGIAPAAGTINTDLDISPVQNSILSGQQAAFRLNLKVTGALIDYQNARIEVQLPKNADFVQDLNELAIAGVLPTYDSENAKLSYYFETLSSGLTNQVIIKVGTKNGITTNNTKLIASANFTADNFLANATTTATINVTSSSSLTASKSYIRTLDENDTTKVGPPISNDNGIWKITVNALKNQAGILYFKEGSKIKIVDTVPDAMMYVSDDSKGVYDPIKKTVTWEFDAPSIQEQESATDSLFSRNIEVKVKFANNLSNLQQITNTAQVTAVDVSGNNLTKNVSSTINAGTDGDLVPDKPGTLWTSQHFGPLNGTGGEASASLNPNPNVYDDALLSFRVVTSPFSANSYSKDFEKYELTYSIDDNLNLDVMDFDTAEYNPDAGYGQAGGINYKLTGTNAPKVDVYATIDGSEELLIKDIEHANKWYFMDDLGISKEQHISKLRFVYTYRPAGTFQRFHLKFSVKNGYVGPVANKVHFDVSGYNAQGNKVTWDNNSTMDNVEADTGVRQANVVPKPVGVNPILRSDIGFTSQNAGIVKTGSNKVNGGLRVDPSSKMALSAPFESMVLLPEGVKVDKDDPQYQVGKVFFSQFDTATSDGNNEYGTIKVVSTNYKNSGRELVQIKWKQSQSLFSGQMIRYQFNVVVAEDAPTRLVPEIYNFVDGKVFSVPNVSGVGTITDSYRIQDTEDINGNGDSTEYYVKSANQYYLLRQDQVSTEKLVKGALDQEYSNFAHTTVGGAIDYRLKLTNEGTSKVSNMVLMDVLPSVGDLGITDNVQRESKFTPLLTGPVKLPTEWEDKVEVLYSTSKNPSRKDLIKNVVYTSTTIKIQDPADAQDPKWITAGEVTDWESIHSFKIELKENAEWISSENIIVDFTMKAPTDLSNDLVNPAIDEKSRAAWNTFATASNNLQAVEPSRVGVVVDASYDIEVEKVDAEDNTLKLEGAEFTLFDSSKEKIEQATTDNKGVVTFHGIAPGTYFIQETKAPQLYSLNPVLYQIEIGLTGKVTVVNRDNTIVSVEDANEKEIVKLVMSNQKNIIPVTGSSALSMSLLSGLSLIIGSYTYFYLRRQREDNLL